MGHLVEMPNGEVVEVDDNITPDALKQLQNQFKPTRKQLADAGQPRKAPLTDEQREVQTRVSAYKKQNESGANAYLPEFLRPRSAVTTGVNKGVFANFADEIGAGASAALIGIPKAVMHGDVGEIGREYRVSRDTQRELERQTMEEHPIVGTISEIGGAIANPLGTGERIVAGAGKLAGKVGLERAAAGLGGTAERMAASGPMAQAILSGGAQGALNAAGSAENLSDVPGALVNGYGVGALTGGALGGAIHLGARGIQTIKDALPSNAARTAYARIAALLESGKMTPKQARDEIEMSDIMGGNAMVQDLTPGLRAQAAAISRRPNVPSSNELIERGSERIGDRAGRFGQAVRDEAGVLPQGDDALARGANLAAERKAAGANDYREGGVLDTPINATPQLQKYLQDAPEEVQSAMRGAYREMLLRDKDPTSFAGPDGIFTHIPDLRTFDHVKRAFDQQIGQALRSGDKATAQGLSYQLDKLKGVLADANPNNAEYQAILGTQRDMFQKQSALELGQQVLSRIGKDPRVLHKELTALPDHAQSEARIGIIDALINMDNKADPVAAFRNMSRSDAQKKVLEFAFGGKGNLGRFQRWIDREVRGTRADVLTAPGRQSETSRIGLAAADDEAGGVSGVLSNAMRGYAFGGSIGAVSGVTRTLRNIASGTSKFTQEEIAKILLSKGDDLVKGIDATKAYQKARETSNRRRARTMGKAGQQLFTDIAGGG